MKNILNDDDQVDWIFNKQMLLKTFQYWKLLRENFH